MCRPSFLTTTITETNGGTGTFIGTAGHWGFRRGVSLKGTGFDSSGSRRLDRRRVQDGQPLADFYSETEALEKHSDGVYISVGVVFQDNRVNSP